MFFVGFEIEAAQKFDGFQVLSPAKLVGNPLALLARVVKIEHRSDRIHAQAVDVILVEPEHGARHQETSNFAASVVKNESLPVGMKTLPRIGMLKQMRAVEVSKA